MTMNAPEPLVPTFSLQTWRENFLRMLLRGTSLFGLFALTAVYFFYEETAFLAVFSMAYIILLAVTFMRMPYWVRAWTFIFIMYLLGVSGLVETGVSGSARMFFVAFVVIAGMFFSTRTTILAAGFSLVTILIALWLNFSGIYIPVRATPLTENVGTWIIAIASISLLDAVMILGLSLLQNGFERAQKEAQTSLTTLERERAQLEQRVEERTREIVEKTRQLEAASKVARKIAEIRDLQALLNNVAFSIADQFNFYHVGIFLLDDKEQFAALQAASSEGGKKMLEMGHRLAVGQTGIVGYVTGQARARVALDTGADAVFFDNPHLPLTHSEMALPLIVRGRVIGALDIQSEKIDAFSEGDIDVMQTVADQLAIAVENTRLFTESEAVISQFEAITALQTHDVWANYTKRHTPAYQFSAFGVRPMRGTAQNEGPRSLRIPIDLRGQEIGVIHLRRKETSPVWSNRERDIAQEIASQVALALDTSRLLEETQKNAARDQMIANVSNKMRETLDMETVLQTAADELRNAFGLTEAEVRLNPSAPSDRAAP
ncbi:MAG: GAF domain-containing protein [Chloroflexi bacterium]|nr:GAF domain-containing protein [Chloroflexota bacterium]